MEKIGFPAANRGETSFGNRPTLSNHPMRKKGKLLELQPIAHHKSMAQTHCLFKAY